MATSDSVVRRGLLTLPKAFMEPRGPLEEKLAAIWAAVLNLDCIGVDDDFSDLGGDSFDAVTVQLAIENEIGVRVPLSAMIATPTVVKLAKEIERVRGLSAWRSQPPGDAEPGRDGQLSTKAQ